jgi:hypothetical protein
MSSLSNRYFLDSGIAVKHWMPYLKVKGSSLGTGREKMMKNVIVISMVKGLYQDKIYLISFGIEEFC